MKLHGLILLTMLALVLAAPSAAPAGLQRRHRPKKTSHSGKTPAQLRKDLQALKNQKLQLRQQLKTTKRQKDATLKDIYVVDAELGKVQDELDRTTNNLRDSRAEQTRLKRDLGEATKKLDETREQVRKRLRHMYVRGDTSSISALVGTKSVGDIASRRSLLQMIAKRDRQLFTDYLNLRDQVAKRKKRQDQLVITVASLVRQQADQQSQLQDKRDEKGEVLQSLRSKEGHIKQMLSQFEADERDITAEIAAFARRRLRPGEKPLPAFHGHFQRPVSGPVTSGFGMRYHPVLHFTRMHKGIDFGVPRGTPIHAGAEGVVIVAKYSNSFGNMVVIDHGGGISTLYAHCSRLMVGTGERVHRGQQIAASGATGLAAGPHLHWEVWVHDHPVNPMGWF